MNPGLLPPIPAEPAEYPPGEVWTLDRDATVEDICDFIVQYINSDVLVCSSFVLVIWCSYPHLIHRPY
jgi:RNA-dependent RNA polymerase